MSQQENDRRRLRKRFKARKRKKNLGKYLHREIALHERYIPSARALSSASHDFLLQSFALA